jgi:hypothetical protein
MWCVEIKDGRSWWKWDYRTEAAARAKLAEVLAKPHPDCRAVRIRDNKSKVVETHTLPQKAAP